MGLFRYEGHAANASTTAIKRAQLSSHFSKVRPESDSCLQCHSPAVPARPASKKASALASDVLLAFVLVPLARSYIMQSDQTPTSTHS